MKVTKGRARSLLTKLPLILFGLFVGAIIAEVALRVTGYSFPEFYQLDHSRGYSLRPAMEGWYRKEGEAYVQINSDGLRDREHTKDKPKDTFRIALLGDSYAEALQVSQDQAFWSVMEKQLQACVSVPVKNTVGAALGGRPLLAQGQDQDRRVAPGASLPDRPVAGESQDQERESQDQERRGGHGVPPLQYFAKVEVINFGVSGYSTTQQLITLRERVWAYSPDLVLLAITTNNDISDNSRALKGSDEIPYFVYRHDRLVLDDSFKDSRAFRWRQSFVSGVGRWLKEHSRLVQALNEGHRGFKVILASLKRRFSGSDERNQTSERRDTAEPVVRSEELGIDNLIYVEPTSAVWRDAWKVTESLIKQMMVEVSSHGTRFVVVTLSNPPQVAPNAKVRQAFMERVGTNDLFYPDNRLQRFAVREGIPIITLGPDLQAFAEENNLFLHGFGSNIGNGHWNVEGHRAAGELLARKLCEKLLNGPGLKHAVGKRASGHQMDHAKTASSALPLKLHKCATLKKPWAERYDVHSESLGS